MPASSPPLSLETERWLGLALRLAAKGRYRTSPNPRVGAVIVKGGRAVGAGFHAALGGPHAEIQALVAAGSAAQGATLYVTLEPCSHHGRTPPCVDAVIASGARRVVACHRDPNPQVAGGGFRRLAAAGIEVESGFLVDDAVLLNLAFLTFHLLRRPAVTLKWAMTLDGRIATAAGDSRWISSPAGRQWGLALREEHDAILVGSGTLVADDPRLDRRLGRAPTPILRVILDRRLRVGPSARCFGIEGPVVVYTESPDPDRKGALEAVGAEVVRLPEVAPAAVLAELAARGVQSVLVEGGSRVLGAFAASGTFDRVAVNCAPKVVGGALALGPVGGPGAPRMEEALRLEAVRVGRRGDDVVWTGVRQGCLRELSVGLAV